MKLKPDDRWQWYYDSEHDRVMLDLADGLLFRSHYAAKMVVPDAFQAQAFCVDDAALYFEFDDQCQKLSLDETQRAELVLNGLIASRFLKPMMPKSWYFAATSQPWQPSAGELVITQISFSEQTLNLLVVESSEQASLCVIADPRAQCASSKVMTLGEAIKIMNDRLQPRPSAIGLYWEQAV